MTRLKKPEARDLKRVAKMAEHFPEVMLVGKQMEKAREETLDCLFGPERNGRLKVTIGKGPLGLVRALIEENTKLKERLKEVGG